MEKVTPEEVYAVIEKLGVECHQISKDHGWWEGERNDGELIALMHSELSEALEWLRKDPKAKSDHIPAFLGLEEELADVVIRILEYGIARNLDLAGAIIAKMKFNEGREYKHGGKKF